MEIHDPPPKVDETPSLSEYRWPYQWYDSLNGLSSRRVRPLVQDEICREIIKDAKKSTVTTLLVSGELGIGKSTLSRLLVNTLFPQYADRETDDSVKNALLTTQVIEAWDLEDDRSFARRIDSCPPTTPLVILARPIMAESSIPLSTREPSATITLAPFVVSDTVFRECLDIICRNEGITNQLVRDRVAEVCGTFPETMLTPFYFREAARKVQSKESTNGIESPLELILSSLVTRIGTGTDGVVAKLKEIAWGEREATSDLAIAGIIGNDGHFVHAGYRSVLLAVTVIKGERTFADVCAQPICRPSVELILSEVSWQLKRRGRDAEPRIVTEIDAYCRSGQLHGPETVDIRAKAANFLSASIRSDDATQAVREECMTRLGEDNDSRFRSAIGSLSSALSTVGLLPLLRAKDERFSAASGYFKHIDRLVCEIGASAEPERKDDAKPVRCYSRQEVAVGPFWVSRFLVTNDQFREFWSCSEPESYYKGAGRQWVLSDRKLLSRIESDFDLISARCFWKEVSKPHGSDLGISMLEIAKDRATRKLKHVLWEQGRINARYNGMGCPVVGVTWWDAQAFCRWWEDMYLDDSFGPGARVQLLTDWEWEALRRTYVGRVTGRTAHVRPIILPDRRKARQVPILRPLHVGLFSGGDFGGVCDLVGNVWEWTRSRVYGRIVNSPRKDQVYGETAWTHGPVEDERIAKRPWRDVVDEEDDLFYRSVRGGSFFAVDPNTALDPAYRLCDPPFSSYADLGFRIAVYPNTGSEQPL
ncbi:MAG: formylglycine-generating enzyme family protein [Micrococcales bacterium]|nr:formylglycine-generating enzyme family protein [Micrococcales bacterium]